MAKEFKSILDDYYNVVSDWNKVFIWLGKIKSLILKDGTCIANEKYTLAKRLAQCLHPECVNAVHLTTLEIYNIIFKLPDFIEDFALFCGGLFPFFEYANRECKLIVLQLVMENILNKAEQLTFAFPGLVCSLLPGFKSTPSDIEIDNKIIGILDSIAHKDKQGLFGAVWQALLRSPRVRLQALSYLSLRLPASSEDLLEYLPQKNLMINSLIASMNGPDYEVQKLTLELLKTHFPVDCSNEIFSDFEKIMIIENGFKLLKSPNEELVWGWLFSPNSLDSLMDIKQRALKKLFEAIPKKPDESIVPLETVKKIMEKSENSLEFLSPIIVPMFSYANKYNDTQLAVNINSCIQSIIFQFPTFEKEIWVALQISLNEDLKDDLRSTIDVIKFFLSSFRNIEEEEKSLIPLLSTLLFGIRQLSVSLGPALELIQIMVNRLPASVPSLSPAIRSYHTFFASISSDPAKVEHLKISASLLLSLESHTIEGNEKDWIKCLVEAMHNENTEVALTGIENIIELLKNKNSGYKVRRDYRELSLS
jgi:Dopey, N-terminal